VNLSALEAELAGLSGLRPGTGRPVHRTPEEELAERVLHEAGPLARDAAAAHREVLGTRKQRAEQAEQQPGKQRRSTFL